MPSSVPVGAMNEASAAPLLATSADDKPSRFLHSTTITAITLLLTTLLSLPSHLLAHPASTVHSFRSASLHAPAPNSSQYGQYPMLYEDPNNQWTPAAGFLFNMSTVDIDLNKVALSAYQGNITLVTNVASF